MMSIDRILIETHICTSAQRMIFIDEGDQVFGMRSIIEMVAFLSGKRHLTLGCISKRQFNYFHHE